MGSKLFPQLNTHMKFGRLQLYYYAKQLILWFPAPVFLLGAVYSFWFTQEPICGSTSYTMTLMWLLMSLAHLGPYIRYWEVRYCPNGCGCS